MDQEILKNRREGMNAYTLWVVAFICTGSVSYGYAASVISITLGQPSFLNYFKLTTSHNGTALLSATNGLYFAGGVIGVMILPFVSDTYGRRAGIGSSAVLLVLSAAFLAGSVHIAMFLVFRFVAGAGAFMMLMAIPVYLSEVVPPRLRGALIDVHATALNFGYMLAAWVGYGFYFWKDDQHLEWRPPLALQALWPLVLLAGLFWMPESPRWLMTNDREEEAHKVLRRLHSDKNDPTHNFALKEFYQIQKQAELDVKIPHSWLDLFKKPSYLKRVYVASLTNGLSQCSGVLVINSYGPLLYAGLGYSVEKQLVFAAGWVTVATAFNFLAIFLVDRFPRPKYIAIGLLLCASCIIVEAAIIKNFVPSTNDSALGAGVAMLFLFVVAYSIFVDGTQFSYLCEIFPNTIRVKGTSFAIATGGIVDLIYLQCAPIAFETIGWKYYIVFIVTTVLGAILMWTTFPDTKDKPLEEIAAVFGDTEDVAVFQADIHFDDKSHQPFTIQKQLLTQQIEDVNQMKGGDVIVGEKK